MKDEASTLLLETSQFSGEVLELRRRGPAAALTEIPPAASGTLNTQPEHHRATRGAIVTQKKSGGNLLEAAQKKLGFFLEVAQKKPPPSLLDVFSDWCECSTTTTHSSMFFQTGASARPPVLTPRIFLTAIRPHGIRWRRSCSRRGTKEFILSQSLSRSTGRVAILASRLHLRS